MRDISTDFDRGRTVSGNDADVESGLFEGSKASTFGGNSDDYECGCGRGSGCSPMMEDSCRGQDKESKMSNAEMRMAWTEEDSE